jgi:hypothetical protein
MIPPRVKVAVLVALGASLVLGGCLLVDSFGNYDVIDGGAEAGSGEAGRGDASLDGGRDGSSDAPAAACHADLNSDPNNCGSCYHSCGGYGASCQAGSCTPAILIPALDHPAGLYVLSGSAPTVVYLAMDVTDGGIAVWHDGTSAVVAQHEDHPHSVVVPGDGNLYWTSANGVRRCALTLDASACDASNFGPPKQDSYRIIEGPDADVYWSVQGQGEIWHASLDGGEAGAFVTELEQPLGLRLVTSSVTGEHTLYWTSEGPVDASADAGGIWRIALVDGGMIERVIGGQNHPQRVVVTPPPIFMMWTNYGEEGEPSGGLAFCAFGHAQCQPKPMPGNCVNVHAADGLLDETSGVYFLAGDSVISVPLTDAGCGEATNLTTMTSGASDLGQDPHFIYWTEYRAGGGVLRLAKPPSPP